MYAGIIIWSLCGGCRSTERLYFLKYCNPHLFCFFTRNTALRSLSDHNALGRTVALNAADLFPDDFSFFCHFQIIFKLLALPQIPLFPDNLDQTLESTASVSLVFLYFQLELSLLGLSTLTPLQRRNQPRSCLWLNWWTGSAGYTRLTLLETCTAQRKEVIHLVLSDKARLNSLVCLPFH